MERQDVTQNQNKKQENEPKIHKQEKSSLQSNKKEEEKSHNQRKKKDAQQQKEKKDEETESRFGVLGEKQVGVVGMEELVGETRKANGSEEKKLQDLDDPEHRVYNRSKTSQDQEYYYKMHECN